MCGLWNLIRDWLIGPPYETYLVTAPGELVLAKNATITLPLTWREDGPDKRLYAGPVEIGRVSNMCHRWFVEAAGTDGVFCVPSREVGEQRLLELIRTYSM